MGKVAGAIAMECSTTTSAQGIMCHCSMMVYQTLEGFGKRVYSYFGLVCFRDFFGRGRSRESPRDTYNYSQSLVGVRYIK